MNIVISIREFKSEIEKELQAKTTWGRNEILEVINKEYQIALEKLVEMKHE